MARTIGSTNKRIIKSTVERLMKERTTPWGEVSYLSPDEVMDKLPESMFDTWEGAYSEISTFILDSITNYNKKLGKVI